MLANTTVSHVSPLLNYIPRSAWYEGTPSADPGLLSYTSAGYHATNATRSGSASISFSWDGNAIWIYGGYTTSLGPYRVTIDGNTTDYDGYTDGAEQFNHLLFGASGLAPGQHSLRITNTGDDSARPVFKFDHLIFESNLGDIAQIEHNNTQCVWRPSGAEFWEVDAVSHTTWADSGAMGMNFSGHGVAVYGELDADSAPFSVTIDGQTSLPLYPNTAAYPLRNQSTLLYITHGLFDGNHTIWIENNPTASSTVATKMSISSMSVFTKSQREAKIPNISSPAPTQAGSPPSSSDMSNRSTLIFGVGFGALGFVILCVTIWRLIIFRRHRIQRQADDTAARPFLSSGTAASSASHSTTTLPRVAAAQNRWPGPGGSPPPSAAPFLSLSFPRYAALPREKGETGWVHARDLSGEHPVPARLEPLRRQLQGDSGYARMAPPGTPPAPAYFSIAATASDTPDLSSPQARGGSTEKPPETSRRLVGSPAPSLPSARVHVRARSDFQMANHPDLQMPPPYRFLDMH